MNPSAHAPSIVASPLRHAPPAFALAAAVLAAGTAHADPIDDVSLCDPRQPVARCQPMPPGLPPRLSQPEIDALIARAEAEFRAKDPAIIYAQEAARRDSEHLAAWRERAEAAMPGSIRVAFPSIEMNAGFRAGSIIRRSYGHAGPTVGLGFHFDQRFGIDVPVALMQTWAGTLGSWATVGINPAFVISNTSRSSMVYARFGPDLLIPTGAPGTAPNVMIGGHAGFGMLGFVAQLPNYGYAGFGFDLDTSLRGGAGGAPSALDHVRFGFDGTLFLRLAL